VHSYSDATSLVNPTQNAVLERLILHHTDLAAMLATKVRQLCGLSKTTSSPACKAVQAGLPRKCNRVQHAFKDYSTSATSRRQLLAGIAGGTLLLPELAGRGTRSVASAATMSELEKVRTYTKERPVKVGLTVSGRWQLAMTLQSTCCMCSLVMSCYLRWRPFITRCLFKKQSISRRH
jgi:hypothetical protein